VGANSHSVVAVLEVLIEWDGGDDLSRTPMVSSMENTAHGSKRDEARFVDPAPSTYARSAYLGPAPGQERIGTVNRDVFYLAGGQSAATQDRRAFGAALPQGVEQEPIDEWRGTAPHPVAGKQKDARPGRTGRFVRKNARSDPAKILDEGLEGGRLVSLRFIEFLLLVFHPPSEPAETSAREFPQPRGGEHASSNASNSSQALSGNECHRLRPPPLRKGHVRVLVITRRIKMEATSRPPG
jgi:hypothetical protein